MGRVVTEEVRRGQRGRGWVVNGRNEQAQKWAGTREEGEGWSEQVGRGLRGTREGEGAREEPGQIGLHRDTDRWSRGKHDAESSKTAI